MRNISLGVVLCLIVTGYAFGNTIAVWNFNEASSDEIGYALELPADYGNGLMTSGFPPANISYSSGTTLNSVMGDPAGQALLLKGNANNGGNLTWMVDTSGFSSIGVSFATRRTSTGFNDNQFLYSTDSGSSWISFGFPYVPSTSFALQSFDLGGISELAHNIGAGFRIVFDGATSSAGNNRIDNLVISGSPGIPPDNVPVPEPSTISLMLLGLSGAVLFGVKKRSP